MTTCEALVYRGQWSTIRRETCGKPVKGWRTMARSEDVQAPACGIHMRARDPLWWGDRVRTA
jgi:hypothetical protein